MGSCRYAGALALVLALAAALIAPATAATLAPGTYGLRTLGRLDCGFYHGFWSVKPCGGSYPNTVDEWKVDDGSGRQQWKLAPHPSGKGVTIQVLVCLCIRQPVPTRSMTHMKHMHAACSLLAEPPTQKLVPPSSPRLPHARTRWLHWAWLWRPPGT